MAAGDTSVGSRPDGGASPSAPDRSKATYHHVQGRIDTSTTSRRRLLAAATPAVLALSGAAVAAPTAHNPDAELIGLCADFDALERRIDALFEGVSALEFDAADAVASVIEVDQRRLLDRICTLTPSTDEGCKALAQSVVLLSPDYADPALPVMGTMDERLANTLVRGMMGRAVA